MPKKNRKSGEPISLPVAPQYFHRRDWKDYFHEVDTKFMDEKTNRYLIQVMDTGLNPYCIHISPHLDYLRKPYIKELKEACVDIANQKSEKAFWDDIKKGKLCLVGYRTTGDCRLLQIPNIVLTDPTAFENWRKGQISGSGLRFENVGVLKAAEANKVPEISKRRRSQKVDKGPALDQCKKCLLKERERWKAEGCPLRGWKPQGVYKRQALDELQERGLSHRDFDAIFKKVFPELIGNTGRSGWRSENDNHQWISDT